MKTLPTFVLILLLLAVAGCGTVPSNSGGATQPTDIAAGGPVDSGQPPANGQSPPATAAPTTAAPAALAPVALPQSEAAKMLQALPTPGSMDTKSMVEDTKADLLKRLATTLADKEINTAELTQVIWADASLGCPAKDTQYVPALTPGYLLVLRIGDKLFEYHSGMDQKFTYCENPVPPVTGLDSLIEKARQNLAKRLGVDISAIKLVSGSEVIWPDASLGCPQPDKIFAPAQVPGYLIILENAGKQYEYHAAKDEVMVSCDKPVPPVSGLDILIEKAKQDLAQRQALQATAISLVNSYEMLWPDASLGCPQPDMVYTQAQVPGYLITLKAGDKQFEYHTDKDQTVIYCENSGAPPVGDMAVLVDKSKAELAQRMSLQVNQIGLVEATEVVWPDTSLGCPQPGMMYAQIMTPGYKIILTYGNMQFEYHTGNNQAVVFCDKAIPLPDNGSKSP
jgi:hypothetical protein